MKKNNLWRIIWIIGIYAVLISILYLVVMYKVKWEDKDFNTYLYFYSCSNQVCTSSVPQSKYYGKALCEDHECPFIKDINDNYVVLSNGTKSWIYDFGNEKIINNKYDDYKYLSNDNYVVTSNGLQGIINKDGKLIVDVKYKEIMDFKDNILSLKIDGKYYYLNLENSIQSNKGYDEILLINKEFYGYKENNNYYIASFNNNSSINGIAYNYLYVANDVIFTISNKQVHILDTNLRDTLIMNINTNYEYTTGQERDSLDISSDGNYLYFTIVSAENKFILYKYDLNFQKFV